MTVRIPAALTLLEAEVAAKRRWWIRNDSVKDGDPSRWQPIHLDGTEPLEVSLPPGTYTIGAGPTFRRVVKIGVDGEEVTSIAACITVGCSGTIAFRSSDPLPSCDPFELTPPRARLCESCRGAP